jgi:hypothetical protein
MPARREIMKTRTLVLLGAIFVSCSFFTGQVSSVMAADTSKKGTKSGSSSQKEKQMDQKRKNQADKIVTKMHDNGASKSDIQAQKKANKKHFGHEGEFSPEKY